MAGLYLHIPFCRRKCSYCDFYSLEASEATIRGYTDLLIKHLIWAAQQGWPHMIDTVYFGGGTPSLLFPEEVSSILETINREYSLSAEAEISFEVNPGTISLQNLTGYRSAGINRLSLGLQSCKDKHLQQLGRLHTNKEGVEAVTLSRKAGFANLSLDLMFALPGQTTADLHEEIDTFAELGAEHLSCYGLTAEEDTPLYKKVAAGTTSLPEESFYADAFLQIHERLESSGYDHYEIANYARPGRECRHNCNYWGRGTYLGIGAGAHSFFNDQWGSRWQVPADLDLYHQALHSNRNPLQCLETFTRDSACSETVYLAMRTRKGIDDTTFEQRFQCRLKEAFPEAVAQSAQWLIQSNGQWSFSPEGWLLFDRLILPFL